MFHSLNSEFCSSKRGLYLMQPQRRGIGISAAKVVEPQWLPCPRVNI